MDLQNRYVHVIIRKILPDEPRRHFLGKILEHSSTFAIVEGVGFYFDGSKNMFVKNPDIIKRIIPLISSGIIVTLGYLAKLGFSFKIKARVKILPQAYK